MEKRGRDEMELLSRYEEQEKHGRATKILIQVANTVVMNDVTNVLSMFFLGKESPEYHTTLENCTSLLGMVNV